MNGSFRPKIWSSKCQQRYGKYYEIRPQTEGRKHTIFLSDQRLVDDIVVVNIKIPLVMAHLELESVNHWDEFLIIGGRARIPILAEICKHIDMVP